MSFADEIKPIISITKSVEQTPEGDQVKYSFPTENVLPVGTTIFYVEEAVNALKDKLNKALIMAAEKQIIIDQLVADRRDYESKVNEFVNNANQRIAAADSSNAALNEVTEKQDETIKQLEKKIKRIEEIGAESGDGLVENQVNYGLVDAANEAVLLAEPEDLGRGIEATVTITNQKPGVDQLVEALVAANASAEEQK